MPEVPKSPMRIQQRLNLTELGISQRNLHCGLFIESDKYIHVCEGPREEARLVFIDMSKPTKVSRKPSDCVYYDRAHYEYVIVNLSSRVIARRVGRRLRILRLGTETTLENEMKAHTMEDEVEFWKWINNDTIGVVTETAVYHWSIEEDSEPVKVFNRLWRGEIHDYLVDHSLKWMALINVSGFGDPFDIQLYSVDRKVSRSYQGFSAAFTEFNRKHNSEPSILFCYANLSPTGKHPLHIVELDQAPGGDQPYNETVVDMCLSEDFPFSLHISQKFNIIYIITHAGNVHLYDVESGHCIYKHLRSIGRPVVTVPHLATSGVLVVNSDGEVLSVSIDEVNIVSHIKISLKNHELAQRLISRWNLTAEKIRAIQLNIMLNHKLIPPLFSNQY